VLHGVIAMAFFPLCPMNGLAPATLFAYDRNERSSMQISDLVKRSETKSKKSTLEVFRVLTN
jgi:hypothetical protein